MDNLYIIIPAYNEEETINSVINEWYEVIEKVGNGSRLVIIDDGSKDSTFKLMQEAALTKPFFEPITKQNSGHGATVLFGYHYAIKKNAAYIFQTDSDGQTVPAEFWKFWKLRKNYAMVIGNRTLRQDGWVRIFVTKTLKLALLLSFHVIVPDANTPFRLLQTQTLKDNIKYIPKEYNLSNVLLSVIYAKRKLPVKYLPITFLQRQGGVNSINMRKIILIGKKAFHDFLLMNKHLKKYI